VHGLGQKKRAKTEIPYPQYSSYLHTRIPIPKETHAQILARWKRQPRPIQALDAVLSRMFAACRRLGPNMPHVMMRWYRAIFRIYFKVFNRLKVYGVENVPKSGAIFYVNHPGQLDPVLLLASLPFESGALIAWGHGWFMDMLEACYGLLSLRYSNVNIITERIIREILCKNRYFAIWPEGHPTYSQLLEDGHSSIIRVYSVLNCTEDRIPFVPVLLRGAEIYRLREKTWGSHQPLWNKTKPISVHFFPPVFLDRAWLKPPAEGGKSPREMIDYLMHHLAAQQGQKHLRPNRLLQMRRAGHARRAAQK
jgi:1-acyl-sn-glycerol-3-phosphate acyltransferase